MSQLPPANPMAFESSILEAWHANAAPWTSVVQDGSIASRRLVTDTAVIDTVCALRPSTVIDLGCGEGWLVRALSAQGLSVVGLDAVESLIAAAQGQGGGRYVCLDYAAVAAGAFTETADVVVCNFSLLGDDSVSRLLRAVPRLLNPGGALVIQTLHPVAARGDAPYQDGWREGTWAGIEGPFSAAPPWYFRTVESWEQLIHDSGLTLTQRREPQWPGTSQPASLLLVAHRTA